MIDFNRSDFFSPKDNLNSEIIGNMIHDYTIHSDIKNKFEIFDISSINYIKPNSIFFLYKEIDFDGYETDLVLFITNNEKIFRSTKIRNKILVKKLHLVNNLLINRMFVHEDCIEYKDDFDYINGSYISKFSSISDSAIIQKNCTIGRGVKIGKNVIVKHNSVIKNSIICDNTIISENSSIGGTGFGFDLENMGSMNISPQIGIVYIDKNVFIGSNCTIDRAKIDYTYIGKNSMLDNLIHIAHNVFLGSNACIAAQTGISGSVKIGDNLVCGGQVGFAGHITIGNNVKIAAKSGVTKNIKDNSVIAGFPAIDIKLWRKSIINERHNRHQKNTGSSSS